MIPIPDISTPQSKLIVAILCVGVVLGAYLFGRSDGARITEAAWATEKATLNAEAVERLDAAYKRNAATEAAGKTKLAETANVYEMKIGVLKNEKDRAIARARAGGLFINTVGQSCGNTVPEAAPGSGLDSRIQRVRLPDEDADFLISFAADANRVVEQLTACQNILRQERE